MHLIVNKLFLGPESLDIGPGDLDIIENNSRVEPGDGIADFIEQITNPPGPDDGDSLGINQIPNNLD